MALPETRGTVGSLFSVTDHIGEVLGLFFATFMILDFGYQTTFTFFVFFYPIAAIIWVIAVKTVNRDSERLQEILWQRSKEFQI